jgi:hypothetical protein
VPPTTEIPTTKVLPNCPFDNGRLTEALGKDGAIDLVNGLDDAYEFAMDIA